MWTVGEVDNSFDLYEPLLYHWNGKRWSEMTGALVDGTLSSVAAVSARDVWAVGSADVNAGGALIEHWDGRSWKAVAGAPEADKGASLADVAAVNSDDVWAVGPDVTEHYGCGA